MADARVKFDHIHIISQDPQAAADWYAHILGGEITGVRIAYLQAPDGVTVELVQAKA